MSSAATTSLRFRLALSALVALGGILLSGPAAAQSTRPPQGAPDGGPPNASDTRWALGVGVIVAPRPYVDADADIQPIPIIEFYSGRWFVQGIRAGYRFVDSEKVDLDLRIRYRFSGLDPDDSPFLEGMAERRGTVEAGLGLDWSFAQLGDGELGLELRAFADILGRSDGIESSVDLSWRRVFGPGRVILVPAIGMVYQNADQVDYYYGVLPDEATPWRPEYAGASVFNPRVSVLTVYRFTRSWSLTALVSVDFFDDEIESSPIIDQGSEIFGLLGLSYSF